MNPAAKKWVSNLVRVLLSVGVLGVIIWRIPIKDRTWQVVRNEHNGKAVQLLDPTQPMGKDNPVNRKMPGFTTPPGQTWVEQGLLSTFGHIQWLWVLAAVAAYGFAPALQALRWRQLLYVQNVRLSVGVVLRLMWLGLFFNLFLIGAVGGDLIKAYYVSKHTASRAESVITVLVDRIIGLLGLVWLSAVAMGVWLIWRHGTGGVELPWAWLMPGVFVLLMGVVFYSRPLRRVSGIAWLIGRSREGSILRRLDAAVLLYRHHKRTILGAFAWTFGSHVCLLITVYFTLRAMGVGGDVLPYVLILGPLIFVASGLIPSMGGLGIQEYAFVLLFGPLIGGEGAAAALAAAFVFRLVSVAWSLPGGLFMVLGSHLPSRAQMEQEMAQAGDAA